MERKKWKKEVLQKQVQQGQPFFAISPMVFANAYTSYPATCPMPAMWWQE